MSRVAAGDRTSPAPAPLTPAPEADRARNPDRPSCPACGNQLGAPMLEARDRLYGLPGRFQIARCPGCGLGVTLPLVDAGRLAAFYPTSYGAYDGLPAGLLGLISRITHRLLAWQALHTAPLQRLADRRTGRLLDVGCGRGDLGSWFVRRGWSVVGVEPSPDACAVARQRGVDARAGTLADVELESGAYDVVVFRHSLEHVIDPVADLSRVREALGEQGIAIVTVPNFGSWQRRLFGDRWLHLDVPRHRIHFDADSLRETLTRAGFSRVEICTASSAVALPASLQYAIAGRCLFPSGFKLRAAIAVCSLTTPLSWLVNRIAGGGDVLHAVAYKQS
jgi:SAM-dependent methyltransferase